MSPVMCTSAAISDGMCASFNALRIDLVIVRDGRQFVQFCSSHATLPQLLEIGYLAEVAPTMQSVPA